MKLWKLERVLYKSARTLTMGLSNLYKGSKKWEDFGNG